MNEKYAGKTIVLPKATTELLITMQQELKSRLGFEPSLSETVAVAVTRWKAEEM